MSVKELEIIRTLEKIRPYLQGDGGDLQYVGFEDGIVTIKVLGACTECMSLDYTISSLVEALLMDEVEGVLGVQVAE